MAIRLIIGCRCYLFSEGLKRLLEDNSDVNTIGIFTEGMDLKEIIKLKPDLILADFNILLGLPADFAINKKLKILLIDNGSPLVNTQIPELLSRGVVGILPPGTDSILLKKAIKAVSVGELWIDRKTLRNILSNEPSMAIVDFTKQEEKIVSLIRQGYRNKEIAQKLNISEQTVKSHCNNIYRKAGVSDRLQLALYSYRIWPECIKGIRTRV